MSQAKQAFREEVSERKRMASGARGRTGKQGHVGSMRTPADILSGPERRKYEQPGEVKVWSIYEDLMPIEQFRALSKRERTLYLFEWKKRFTTRQISEGLGVEMHQTYYLFKTHGIQCRQSGEKDAVCPANDSGNTEKDRTEPASKEQTPTPQPAAKSSEDEAEQTTSPDTAVAAQTAEPPAESARDCDFQLHGLWDGAAVAAKLKGLAAMTSQGGKYWVNISWREM